MSKIFINYRREDSEGYVGRLYDHLARHFTPEDIFMDVSSIEPGADFVAVLEDAVAACDVFLAMIGPQWLTCTTADGAPRLAQWNDYVRIEIASALAQNKRVIPVLVGRAAMPDPAALPDDIQVLTRRNAVELSHQRFAYDVERLIDAVQGALSAQFRKPHSSPAALQRKTTELRAVQADLINATDSPLYEHRVANRYFPVLGAGNPDAAILFIGEAPGKHEAAEGKPFVGPSGDVLDSLLDEIGLRRADVYLTNLLLDRPPDNRDPLPAELAYYAPYVDRVIDIIQPSVIVTLGRFAMTYVLKKFDLPEKRGKISQLHGTLIKTRMPYGDIHIVPLYHPAVVLYSASQRATLSQDFARLRVFI